jgi:hypothetical protein
MFEETINRRTIKDRRVETGRAIEYHEKGVENDRNEPEESSGR